MILPFVSRKKFDEAIRMYDEVVYKLECLLCHATGGRYSKSGYQLSDMERMVTDYVESRIEEAVEEATAALKARENK